MRPNKLECLHLAKTYQSSLKFAGSTRSLPKKKRPPIGFAMALPSNSKTRLERVTNGKPSSLLGLIISDEGKKFYHIDTCMQWKDGTGHFTRVISYVRNMLLKIITGEIVGYLKRQKGSVCFIKKSYFL